VAAPTRPSTANNTPSASKRWRARNFRLDRPVNRAGPAPAAWQDAVRCPAQSAFDVSDSARKRPSERLVENGVQIASEGAALVGGWWLLYWRLTSTDAIASSSAAALSRFNRYGFAVGQQLVGDHTQAVDIACGAERLATDLLRASRSPRSTRAPPCCVSCFLSR
jgi:hypothetical protein